MVVVVLIIIAILRCHAVLNNLRPHLNLHQLSLISPSSSPRPRNPPCPRCPKLGDEGVTRTASVYFLFSLIWPSQRHPSSLHNFTSPSQELLSTLLVSAPETHLLCIEACTTQTGQLRRSRSSEGEMGPAAVVHYGRTGKRRCCCSQGPKMLSMHSW